MHRTITIFIILPMFFWLPATLCGQNSEHLESRDTDILTGVFLEKVTRFVEWPVQSGMLDPEQPFVIGIYGDDFFASTVAELYSSRMIKGKKVIVHKIINENDIRGCHLIFVSSTQYKRLPWILEYTRSKDILTISDSRDFADKGVMVSLFVRGKRMHLAVNEKAVRQSGLIFSYHLLKIAEIVQPVRGDT